MKKKPAPDQESPESKIQEEPSAVMEVGAFEAKTHLSSLLQKVEQGARIVITKRGKPIAELKPFSGPGKSPTLRKPGFGKGAVLYMSSDFDAPLPDFAEYM